MIIRGKQAIGTVPRGPFSLMTRVYRYVLPEVAAQLDGWMVEAKLIPDQELREQAVASITSKRFHCEGGAIYAAANLQARHILIPLIVALQTISDYLDNLCDRSTSMDADGFRQLHLAMKHAVDPSAPLEDYYKYREQRDDGGYLHNLVRTCQSCICMLHSYDSVKEHVAELVALYSELQVHKHIRVEEREPALLGWWEQHREVYPELGWNEFAAATGSTLGMFLLFLGASRDGLTPGEGDALRRMYFPYVCGLHILLDYLIDREEDRIGGDLNFCEYYDNEKHTAERIGWIAQMARQRVSGSQEGHFHRMIVEGLLALYLSDPKVRRQPEVAGITSVLMRGSPWTRLFFWANSVWIRRKQGITQPQIQHVRR